MATYSESFAGQTTGAFPTGFTDRWTSTGSTWAVREKTGALGGKVLEHTRTTTAIRGLSYDAPGTDTDTEILFRFRSTSNAASQIGAVLRGSGAAGAGNGYVVLNTAPPGADLRISRMVGGAFTTLQSLDIPTDWTANTWYWVRFRVNGNRLQAKIWNANVMEPAGWLLDVVDSSPSAINTGGWAGFCNQATTGTRDYDEVAVGTNGDTAAFPPSEFARVTQSVALVLGQEVTTIPARITQSVKLAVAEFFADCRMTTAPLLVLADHVPCLTKWAQCWIITRSDGVVYGFTTLDVPVVCRGVTCYPCDSLMATAAEHSTMLGTAGDMEATGIISDSGISAEDIQAGLFDRATIEVWNQPWDNVTNEIPFRIAAGTLGSVTFGLNQYTFQVRTDAAKLKQTALLETYTPGCRYQFGNQRDSRCPVDLTTITVSGTVDATVVANSSTMSTRRAFIDSTRAEAPGFFNFGRLTWLTGDNAGHSSEVKSSDGSTIVLWDTMPNVIRIGDTYDIHPGCDKTKSGHLLYNADMVDFGGFPDVPGQDSINQTPDQKG